MLVIKKCVSLSGTKCIQKSQTEHLNSTRSIAVRGLPSVVFFRDVFVPDRNSTLLSWYSPTAQLQKNNKNNERHPNSLGLPKKLNLTKHTNSFTPPKLKKTNISLLKFWDHLSRLLACFLLVHVFFWLAVPSKVTLHGHLGFRSSAFVHLYRCCLDDEKKLAGRTRRLFLTNDEWYPRYNRDFYGF